ncbi:MAG: hypothetical protein ACPG8V_01160 [Alphaproteobacteria bacterium]
MSIKPVLSLSLKQKNAPKVLMRQLVKLLPMNDIQLEEVINKEIEKNPFLSFKKSNSYDLTEFDLNDEQINTPSIYKILTPQIESTFKTKKELKIANEILSYIDDDGFLREVIPNFDTDKYQVLLQMQGFEPAGVFSRNLAEFYHAYLYANNKLNPKWEILLDNLHNIAVGDTEGTIKQMGGRDMFDIYLSDLKELPTTPDLPSALAEYISPDIIVEYKDNKFSIKLASNIHYDIDISQDYVENVRNHNLKSTDKQFITEKFSSAKWLKTALIMRAENLLKISSEIINHQSDFLNGGDLKPLSLQQIATATSVHISTVSRIVNNKYFLYNGKTIKLKSMFSYLATDGISQNAIMDKIIELINNEKNTKIILSDSDIVKLLQQQQINISRRTVAKYRKLCKISSSRQRKALTNDTN